MKKTYIYNKVAGAGRFSLLFSLSALLTMSCTFEQEDYFDEPASLRITHVNDQLQQRLVEQSDTTQGRHGWLIQYFVAGTDDYDFEGFNLFGRFYQSGKVTLASNHRFLRGGQANKYTEHSSTYEMLAEEGPVLSFNTWNNVLTVFEDPVDPSAAPNVLVNNGEGMYGDHNLVLSSIDDNEILFRGERHSANVRFVPIDRPWQEYIDAVSQVKNYIATPSLTSYYVTNGTDTMYFSGLNRGYFNYCDRVVDPLVNTVLSCVFTPNGLRLNRTATLGTNKFLEFTMAPDSTCLVSQDDSVRVIATWDKYITNFTSRWTINRDLLTDGQRAIISELEEELKKSNASMQLNSLALGTGGNNRGTPVRGLVMGYQYTSRNRVTTAVATVGLGMTRNEFGQMQMTFSEDNLNDDNLNNFANLAANDVIGKLRQLAATLNGTYTLTPDNYFLPTKATLTSTTSGQSFEITR